MIRQLPVIPTILVVAAAGVMVWLGFWQLGRAEEKAELIERYSQAGTQSAEFPDAGTGEDVWFRRSSVDCTEIVSRDPVSGTAANGAKGWAMRVVCKAKSEGDDAGVMVDLGFTRDLNAFEWEGGMVEGVIAPGPRLVADPPVADLYPLAKPNPGDLPNNHLAYAGQWFFFALTALVIYFFAVRSKLKRRD
ncbi:threonine synthase [Erythrobacter longus]|uniref:SURF1-like protein n=1 Tax=Erythrobacter longus TaxID=1044 RepID=A0A074MBI4_ERYLO|nr:SURF1 family cytochrome oxidase biogenesis protein [Erythrobacter longus]KEO90819.1 threonine synthase [Erythrobacter longus]